MPRPRQSRKMRFSPGLIARRVPRLARRFARARVGDPLENLDDWLQDWRIFPGDGWPAEEDVDEETIQFLTDQMLAVREAASPYLEAGLPPEALLAIVSDQAGTRVRVPNATLLSEIVADLRRQGRMHLAGQILGREPGKLQIILDCLGYTTTVYALTIPPFNKVAEWRMNRARSKELLRAAIDAAARRAVAHA